VDERAAAGLIVCAGPRSLAALGMTGRALGITTRFG
jgi:hypothetical protein